MHEAAWKIQKIMLGEKWEHIKGELRSLLVIYGHDDETGSEYDLLERKVERFIKNLDEGILS